MILGEETDMVEGYQQGFLFHNLQENVQALGLGSGGLASGPTSATDCHVTLSDSLPCLRLSFHI